MIIDKWVFVEYLEYKQVCSSFYLIQIHIKWHISKHFTPVVGFLCYSVIVLPVKEN